MVLQVIQILCHLLCITFFPSRYFSLASAVHAGQALSAHPVTATGKTGRLLGTADTVVQVTEASFSTLSILQTFLLYK